MRKVRSKGFSTNKTFKLASKTAKKDKKKTAQPSDSNKCLVRCLVGQKHLQKLDLLFVQICSREKRAIKETKVLVDLHNLKIQRKQQRKQKRKQKREQAKRARRYMLVGCKCFRLRALVLTSFVQPRQKRTRHMNF